MPLITHATSRCDVCGDEQPSAIDHAPRGWWILHPDHPQLARDGWLICPKHVVIAMGNGQDKFLIAAGKMTERSNTCPSSKQP